jgi:protein-tyrosine phosphatase
MAVEVAREILQRRGISAEVSSCGDQPGGARAVSDAVAVMKARGRDLSGHRSRQIDLDIASSADLILTMERRHLVSVAELGLAFVARAFTLRELAALAEFVGPRAADEPPQRWIERAHRARPPSSTLSLGSADDVSDPMGRSRRAFRDAVAEIERLTEAIFDQLFPGT